MMKAQKQPIVMTVAGLDPSGGAGILADVKTISAFGCYGVAVLTSVTFQNTRQVLGSSHLTAELVDRQAEPLFDDLEIAAIKTGMLPTPEIIREVARLISSHKIPLVVVDPVLTSSSGFDLIDDGALGAFTRLLFPLASLVTPNVAEAQRITGFEIRNRDALQRAADLLLQMGPAAVLITSIDDGPDLSTDLLVDASGPVFYSTELIKSRATHGTGCSFASALACLLASGHALRDSVPLAKQYIKEAIISAPGIGHGAGPLNHFPPSFAIDS